MNKIFLLLTCFIFSLSVFGQKALKGVIIDAENGLPLPGASVFLSNTSVGTTANADGAFSLPIPEGRYDLIVSSIGFETHSQTISSAGLPGHITIKLNPKAKELETVVLNAFEKDGWKKWGQFFLENFIGTSALAQDCILKNKEVIKFRSSKATNEITAIALEPLLIENKALGYTIRYQLEDFTYNFKTRFLYYAGYPLFKPMSGSTSRQRRWENKRKEVYFGSMMHFMRSVFRNTLETENFEVFPLKKIPNTEKARVKEVYKKQILSRSGGSVSVHSASKDSSDYYSRILSQEDYYDVAGKTKLTGDSVAYAVNATTAGMDFPDYLLIIYKNGIAPPEYMRQFPKNSSAIMSQVTLHNQKPIEIQANGSYYQPSDLVSFGYWAWFEKIATMLPFDYKANDRK